MTNPTPSSRRQKRAGPRNPRPKKSATPKGAGSGPAPEIAKDQILPATNMPKGPTGKLSLVVTMLARPEGATIAQISAATGWQAHSIRGAFAGALKKEHGLSIVSQAADSGRVYRLGGTDA